MLNGNKSVTIKQNWIFLNTYEVLFLINVPETEVRNKLVGTNGMGPTSDGIIIK